MKTCSKCKIEKPRSEFHVQKASADGLHRWCKSCVKEWRKSRPEASREADARYRERHPEESKEKSNKWKRKNREKCQADYAKWCAANPEKRKALSAKWYAENRERSAKKCLDWRLANPERTLANARDWAKANPERRRTYEHNREAKKAASGKLSPGIVAELFARQNGRCIFCQVDLTTVTQHLDHIMPLALDGPNTDDNVQLLCARCNTRKGAKHPAEFARIIFEERLATSIASTCSSSADTSQRSRQSD